MFTYLNQRKNLFGLYCKCLLLLCLAISKVSPTFASSFVVVRNKVVVPIHLTDLLAAQTKAIEQARKVLVGKALIKILRDNGYDRHYRILEKKYLAQAAVYVPHFKLISQEVNENPARLEMVFEGYFLQDLIMEHLKAELLKWEKEKASDNLPISSQSHQNTGVRGQVEIVIPQKLLKEWPLSVTQQILQDKVSTDLNSVELSLEKISTEEVVFHLLLLEKHLPQWLLRSTKSQDLPWSFREVEPRRWQAIAQTPKTRVAAQSMAWSPEYQKLLPPQVFGAMLPPLLRLPMGEQRSTLDLLINTAYLGIWQGNTQSLLWSWIVPNEKTELVAWVYWQGTNYFEPNLKMMFDNGQMIAEFILQSGANHLRIQLPKNDKHVKFMLSQKIKFKTAKFGKENEFPFLIFMQDAESAKEANSP